MIRPYQSLLFLQTLLDLFSCPQASIVSRVCESVKLRIAVFSDEPQLVVNRKFECLEIFRSCAYLEVRVSTLCERISVPSGHLKSFQIYLLFEVKFLQKNKKILGNFFICLFVNLIACCLRQKDAYNRPFVLLNHKSPRVSGLLFSNKRYPILRLVPKRLLEGQEQFVDHSIPNFIQCFKMTLRQLWIKFHQSSMQPSKRQTRDDLPRMVNIIALGMYLNYLLGIYDLCYDFAESDFRSVRIIKRLHYLGICSLWQHDQVTCIFLFFCVIFCRQLAKLCPQSNRYKSLPPFHYIQNFLLSLKFGIKLLRSFSNGGIFPIHHHLSYGLFEFFENTICFVWKLLAYLSLAFVEVLLWGLIQRRCFEVDLLGQLCKFVVFVGEVDEVSTEVKWNSVELLGQHPATDSAPRLEDYVVDALLGETQ